MKLIDQRKVKREMIVRFRRNAFYKGIFALSTIFALLVLIMLLYRIVEEGITYINIDFFINFASRKPEKAGIAAALWGTISLMGIVALISLILGVGTAIYLEEYAKQTIFTKMITMNIQTLAGVPSVVFGLLGLTIFVYTLGLGSSILAGGLTMSLLVLPTIVVASQEALRAVPRHLLEASYAVGATKWQTISQIALPSSFSGIMTGCILSLSRAIGEAAPLLVIGALAFVNYLPTSVLDGFTVLPIQIFNWMGRPQEEFQHVAAAGIIVLLLVLFIMNTIAALLRNKQQNRY
ncbi:phosphate ABC transporter permease PstA [Microbacteriaceae bacterium 4G12]